jgi:alkylated DNA repair dioxygenase AlkB
MAATGTMEITCGPHYGRPNYLRSRAAALLASGDVLLAGGGHEDCGRFAEAERYNPVSGTFTLIQPMTRRRTGHTATALHDGTVLIAGGESESGFHLITEATAEIYDLSAISLLSARCRRT